MTDQAEKHAAGVEALIYAIAADLGRGIAALGYPVGMGSAPKPEACVAAAKTIVSNIGDAALSILANRQREADR